MNITKLSIFYFICNKTVVDCAIDRPMLIAQGRMTSLKSRFFFFQISIRYNKRIKIKRNHSYVDFFICCVNIIGPPTFYTMSPIDFVVLGFECKFRNYRTKIKWDKFENRKRKKKVLNVANHNHYR